MNIHGYVWRRGAKGKASVWGLNEYLFIRIGFALPFLQAVCLLQASGMMKSLVLLDFHLSFDKT